MREELDTLLKELKKLKHQGVTSLLMEPETLDLLEQEISKIPQPPQTEAEYSSSVTDQPDGAKPDVHKQPEPTPDRAPVQPTHKVEEPIEKIQTPRMDYHDLPEFSLPQGNKQDKWDWMKNHVLQCPVCNNHVKANRKVVFGVGNLDADIFFCGEAPGEEEELKGEPFVGPAGQLLSKIIQAMGLSREQVYIANIMNWRPETDTPYGNRPPTEDEMAFCMPYLKAQLEIVKPKVIVALGATAVNGLLGYNAKRSITRSHGQWQSFEDTPTIISFHPSYILRNGTKRVKRLIWEDMLAVMGKLDIPINERQQNFFN